MTKLLITHLEGGGIGQEFKYDDQEAPLLRIAHKLKGSSEVTALVDEITLNKVTLSIGRAVEIKVGDKIGLPDGSVIKYAFNGTYDQMPMRLKRME